MESAAGVEDDTVLKGTREPHGGGEHRYRETCT